MSGLKEKTISGMLWSAVERFGYTFIMFLSNLFLARLLSPNDFGLIGMIMVFVAIASIIVDGGFTSALIQKRTINDEDYSTAFHVNIILAIILYVVLYFSAPSVANFYSTPLLADLLRVLGSILIINALSVVQIAKIKRELNFKYLGIVSIVSSLVGCCVGVACAFCSFGVWSLVIQSLTTSMTKSVILFISTSWKPSWVFSKRALKAQFNFGSMVLLSNLVDTVYSNGISLIIGKSFSSKTLGLYTQARTLESVPNQTLTVIVGQVVFPVFSSVQDNVQKLLTGLRKTIRCLVWINFPLMILLIFIADPLFQVLYTEKWMEAVPLFQIACCGGIMLSSIQLNNTILLAQGCSKLYFFSRLLKQSVGFVLILLAAYIGNLWLLMVIGVAIVPYLFFFISVAYTKQVIPQYGFRKQISDILDILVLSLLCGGGSYCLYYCIPPLEPFVQLCVKTFMYSSLYLILSKYFIVEEFQIYLNEARRICIRLKKIFAL